MKVIKSSLLFMYNLSYCKLSNYIVEDSRLLRKLAGILQVHLSSLVCSSFKGVNAYFPIALDFNIYVRKLETISRFSWFSFWWKFLLTDFELPYWFSFQDDRVVAYMYCWMFNQQNSHARCLTVKFSIHCTKVSYRIAESRAIRQSGQYNPTFFKGKFTTHSLHSF